MKINTTAKSISITPHSKMWQCNMKEADTGYQMPENSITIQGAWWPLHKLIISINIPRYMLQVVQPYYTKGGRNVDSQTKFY